MLKTFERKYQTSTLVAADVLFFIRKQNRKMRVSEFFVHG